MSVATVRGGIPTVRRLAVTTGTAPAGGTKVRTPSDICYMIIRVTDNDCKVYFTQKDYEADENFVLVHVASTTYPYGEWRGPVETIQGSAYSDIWLRGSGGASNVELVVFQRRG